MSVFIRPKTLLFERLGLDDVKSRIIAACNGTEYFLASLVAIFLIDRVGRRRLMLWSALGQSLTMVLLAILGAVDNSATQIVSAVLLFVFNSIFALGWLGMTWLYVGYVICVSSLDSIDTYALFSQLKSPAFASAPQPTREFCSRLSQPDFTYLLFSLMKAFNPEQLAFQFLSGDDHWSFFPEHRILHLRR